MRGNRTAHRRLAALASLTLIATGCGGSADQPVYGSAGGSVPPGRSELMAEVAGRGASLCVPAPLAERAARVLIVGLPHVTTPSDPLVGELLEVRVGGVLVTHANVESARQVERLIDHITEAAQYPILIATDEEAGRVTSFASVLGTTPSARRLADESTPAEVQRLAARLGAELADLGINLNLAPVVDLDDGPAQGLVGDRSFSVEPAVVWEYAQAWVDGMADAGLASVVKHFPGHGRSRADPHVQLTEVDASLADLRASDLEPFVHAIADGVGVVMVGHVTYDAIDPLRPATMSPAAYELLRDLGFDGVAITDSVGMGAVNLRWDFDAAAVQAISAGADAVLATDGHQAARMRDALVDAVNNGELDADRLDQAVARMAALAGDDPGRLVCHRP